MAYLDGSFFQIISDAMDVITTKLSGIASGATANDTDANLKNRANHTGTQTASTISDFSSAADARITAKRGENNGIAPLDSSGLVPAVNLPSYVDDVVEVANFAALPGTGETGKIYVLDTPYTQSGVTSAQFRWSGSAYVAIIASPGSTDSVTEGTTNLYFTVTRVLASALTGLSLVSIAVVSATDSVLVAIGKLQAQVSALGKLVSGTTVKAGAFPVTKSGTVGSGTIALHFTADGTSGGAALWPNGPDQDSVQVTVNDALASYQCGWAWSNTNKTLTVTANKLTTSNILTGVLGQGQANAAVVKAIVWGN